MVSIVLASVALVLSSATLLVLARVVVVFLARMRLLEQRSDDGLNSGWRRDLEHTIRILEEDVHEGLRHAKRREERARGVVRGALKRLDAAGVDDPAVEAEAEELGVPDGEGGVLELMPPVHDTVESGEDIFEESPIPGLTTEEWQAFLGEEQA